MHGEFQPMALGSAKASFSHPDWLFELKYDGFRALAHIDGKRTQLVSRNGHPFASFSDLGHAIAAALPYTQRAVLDGEIVCLDRKGRPQFEDLLFRRGVPCFFAFDLLYDGKDRR
jgi:bifunctional non-homologous end joining protein LigD